jgi:hypothetical protein
MAEPPSHLSRRDPDVEPQRASSGSARAQAAATQRADQPARRYADRLRYGLRPGINDPSCYRVSRRRTVVRIAGHWSA